ncbi:SDR family oxidoreductase [Lignipirellula cremea]|uniref:NAD dependent epimerase/dehydratase family protein n=1 Tax=Lignipirellula cremea TaxID=2528010 RepID=A0A518DXC9_9BACT|nr:SDR family oxidoreductase [Lignipirellula cremea]QDU96474.1 NAD dependent epimerase/dehydratase family protein [Lignipirellula cremea]
MPKLVIGCGYLGERAAQRWSDEGHLVYAMTRSAERAKVFEARGWKALVADVAEPDTLQVLADLPPLDTVLFAVGYDRSAGRDIAEVYVDGLANVLKAFSGPQAVSRFLYISSTGVYRQSQGEAVNELSPCEPTREGGKACLAAENLLARHPLGARSVILRLAGIYGPGRVPRRAEILAGEPLPAPSNGHLNLIHVDDAVSVVLQAEAHAPLPRLYVVSDGAPVLRREYYAEVARAYGAAPPTFCEPEPDSPAAQRAAGDKRIDASLMRKELPIEWQYPSYREGLAAHCRPAD